MSEIIGSIDTIDLVTVVYEGDILQLQLQARSIAQHFNAADIGRIFIVVNELSPEYCYSLLQKHVLPEYGRLISKIEIIPMARMMRPHVRIPGQRTQQALKLLAGRLVASRFYLVLDPKNHFIRKCGLEDVIDLRSKKARTYKSRRNRAPDNAMQSALDYFEVQPIDYELAATAPFPFHAATVREMVDEIEAREGAHFDDVMLDRGHAFTEFSLYFAFLLTKEGGPSAHYRFGSRNAALISRRAPAAGDAFREFMEGLDSNVVMTFGIHRSRVTAFADLEWEKVIELWINAGLFDDAESAKRFAEALTQGAARPDNAAWTN